MLTLRTSSKCECCRAEKTCGGCGVGCRNGCIWPAELLLGSEAGAELAAGGGFSMLVTMLKTNHRKGCISFFTQGVRALQQHKIGKTSACEHTEIAVLSLADACIFHLQIVCFPLRKDLKTNKHLLYKE